MRTQSALATANMRFFSSKPTIMYTETDEAPALATYSLFPIVKTYAAKAGIDVVKTNISVASRIISQFPERLTETQREPDRLAELGVLCKDAGANIIKLPNISASVPQLCGAIDELRAKGYNVPPYVANPSTEEEKAVSATYAKVLGSAVNPVLREGNSDRRVASPVKSYAQKNPHRLGKWSADSRSHVAHMSTGDFFANESSHISDKNGTFKIVLTAKDGSEKVLKESVPVQAGEVFDSSVMHVKELTTFIKEEIQAAKKDNILFSLHMKATMMKVSDPVIFGHVVRTFFEPVFNKYKDVFQELGVNANNGFNDVLTKIKSLPQDQQDAIQADITACYAERPSLAMVDSSKGITNLHVPSDVIIDASMPVVLRDSGKMWNKDDALEDVKCVIPDRCYATMYQEIMSYCKEHGQFDVATMGNVSNVGLMAQKAEEYGSHDKTFVIPSDGVVEVFSDDGKGIFYHDVKEGDIWRMCQTKSDPIRDWVRLAVSRARTTGDPVIFWLDEKRGHDKNMIDLVNLHLKDHDTKGLDISIASPVNAMRRTCERCTAGKNTISATGNVLRDYLTDLFPILELGTSAKMLSIVPLLAGGGLFETGAGGSAPKHVDQFLKEGHLRWDSLGEYLAVAVSLEHLGQTTGNEQALKLGATLNQAIQRLLENRKSPSRKVHEIDNRASNFYIALYWAEFMEKEDPATFKGIAESLRQNRSKVVEEFKACQGKAMDVGGYYKFDDVKASAAMCPSATFNKILSENA